MTGAIDSNNRHYRKLFDVIDQCAARQITLTANGDRLHVDATAGGLTPDLRAALAEHKTTLLRYLTGELTVKIKPDDDPVWTDPRPDLKGDSWRWSLLLEKAYRQDVDVFGMLNVLRGMGARLETAGPAGWSLRPEGPLPAWQIARGDDMTVEEYDDFRRRYLLPHAATLDQLLRPPTIETTVADDQAEEDLRIPLEIGGSLSETLAERGLRIVGGDHNGTLFVADLEGAA